MADYQPPLFEMQMQKAKTEDAAMMNSESLFTGAAPKITRNQSMVSRKSTKTPKRNKNPYALDFTQLR